jgi:hypothetical protein
MRTEFATPVSSIASRAVRVLDASRVADALNRRLEEQGERGRGVVSASDQASSAGCRNLTSQEVLI